MPKKTQIITIAIILILLIAGALYLFWLGTTDSVVLGLMHLFMIGAYYFGVRRMNIMINDSLHFRFDNEMLVIIS